MAELSFAELVKAVAEHPDFREHREAGVKPETALYIAFARPRKGLKLETFAAADGSLIVIDRDADGLVWGIEIT